MTNFLRADLWRLWRSRTLPGMVLACVLVTLASMLFLWGAATGMFGTAVGVTRTVARSFVDAVANGMTSGLVTLFATWMPVWLVASDLKAGSFRSLLARRGARAGYVAAKLATSLLVSALVCAVLLASYALVPLPLGLGYELVPPAGEVVAWWALATLAALAYCALAVCAALAMGTETGAWVAGMVLALQLVGSAAMAAVGLLPLFAPALTGACRVAQECLPIAQCLYLGRGLDVFALGAVRVGRIAATCACWSVVAGAGAFAVFRRRAL